MIEERIWRIWFDVMRPCRGEPWIDDRRELREDVDDGQNPDLLAHGQLIMDEVHRPGVVRLRGRTTILPELRLHPSLWSFVPQLQAQSGVEAIGSLDVRHPALPLQDDMHTAVAVAHAGLGDLFDALFQVALAAPAGLVVIGGRVNRENTAGPADRNVPFTANLVHQFALADRAQVFRRRTS